MDIQATLFNIEDFKGTFYVKPSKTEQEFFKVWSLLEEIVPASLKQTNAGSTLGGRPGFSLLTILAVWVVKEFFHQRTISGTLEMISSNANLRQMCCLYTVPSNATVSKLTPRLRDAVDIEELMAQVVSMLHSEHSVGHLSIDSSMIDCREKPVNGRREATEELKKQKRKPGRPKDCEMTEEQKAEKLRQKHLEECMTTGNLDEYISSLNMKCAVTAKTNSKGFPQYRTAYKIHLAVDDQGIPVSHYITGANVHDSKLAIPLMRKATQRCFFYYSLMDAGYVGEKTSEFARSIGKVPIVDTKRAKGEECKPKMDPATAQRYKKRTEVERTNNELKSNFLPHVLYSRGKNAHWELNLAVLLLTMKKTLKVLKELKEREAA